MIRLIIEDAAMDEDGTEASHGAGGLPPEKVEDRPGVGEIKPEDYPEDDREAARPDAGNVSG